jgi:hypothetical protein
VNGDLGSLGGKRRLCPNSDTVTTFFGDDWGKPRKTSSTSIICVLVITGEVGWDFIVRCSFLWA